MRKLKSRDILPLTISILFFIFVFLFFPLNAGTINWGVENLKDVANLAMKDYSSIFLLMAFLLIGSMLGAFYLASKEEKR